MNGLMYTVAMTKLFRNAWLRACPWLNAVLLVSSACGPVWASAGVPDEQAEREARIARVEQGLSTRVVVKGAPGQKRTLAERMAFHQVPAVSIALINHGRVEWARAYGVLDASTGQPATTTSLFQAASVSKSLSAMGALQLVEQGRLSLDAPANSQLTAWKIPDNAFTRQRPVSLRMLLNHSAGMNVHGFYGYAPGQPLPTLLQILDGAPPANSPAVRVEALPGSAWVYSGGGYSVVQQMMTEAGAQPFPALMQTLVLDPLGMQHSSFAYPLPAAWQAQAASAHDADGHPDPARWQVHPESAAAGLWTTPTDLAQLVIEIQNARNGKPGKVLSPAMTTTMLARGLGEYGLGLYVETLGEGSSFSHSGGTRGFRAQFYGYTHTGQGIAVLTNSDNGAALIEELLVSVAAVYGWPEFGTVEKVALPADGARNRAVAGDYVLVEKPAHLIAEGDQLYFQSDLFGGQRMEVFAESAQRFFMTAQDMALEIERDRSGEVTGFVLVRGNNRYRAKRQTPLPTTPER